MNNRFSVVPLHCVAAPVERGEVPAPGTLYRQLGVRLWGQGAYERESLDGSQTKYKTLSCVEAGDIVVNKIWARNGSVAVVTESLAGCYVSGEFPTFVPHLDKLDARWFHWLTKTEGFWRQCDEKSRGTSGKNRIRPEQFLAIEIPLPPLCEQQRIVARIEELAARIEEARGLRRQAVEEAGQLVARASSDVFSNMQGSETPLGELLREGSQNGLASRPSDAPPGMPILRISAATSRPDATIDESDHKYLRVDEHDAAKYRVLPGDLLACRFNGNLHYVGRFAIYRGYSGKPHLYPDKLIRFRVDQSKVQPEFVQLAMNSPRGRSSIESFCATTAGNIGISAGNLKNVVLAVPPHAEQTRIVVHLNGLQTKVDALKQLQAETAAELDALLPSVLDRAFSGAL